MDFLFAGSSSVQKGYKQPLCPPCREGTTKMHTMSAHRCPAPRGATSDPLPHQLRPSGPKPSRLRTSLNFAIHNKSKNWCGEEEIKPIIQSKKGWFSVLRGKRGAGCSPTTTEQCLGNDSHRCRSLCYYPQQVSLLDVR